MGGCGQKEEKRKNGHKNIIFLEGFQLILIDHEVEQRNQCYKKVTASHVPWYQQEVETGCQRRGDISSAFTKYSSLHMNKTRMRVFCLFLILVFTEIFIKQIMAAGKKDIYCVYI